MGRVIMRLKAKFVLSLFQRWAEAAAEQREERARVESKRVAEAHEFSMMSKYQKIIRALFSRGFRICSLTIRRCMSHFLQRVMKRWRLHVRLERALFSRYCCQSVRFFLLWREAMPDLRRRNKCDGNTMAKKILFSKAWR
jgi:hypothetical protein